MITILMIVITFKHIPRAVELRRIKIELLNTSIRIPYFKIIIIIFIGGVSTFMM